MNTQPIETAHDPDLRLSIRALERAALRARKIAQQTATALVVSHNGVIELLQPDQVAGQTASVQEPATEYKSA